MIRITVQLVSAIHPDRSRLLGIAEISNDGGGTLEVSNYDVRLSKWAPKEKQTWKRGKVTGFDRKRRGVWDLFYIALRNILGDRNPSENGFRVLGTLATPENDPNPTCKHQHVMHPDQGGVVVFVKEKQADDDQEPLPGC